MIETSRRDEIHLHEQVILGVMAKFWTPGKVKTRLGKTVGLAASARLHRVFCLHLAQQLAHAADERNFCVAPADQVDNLANELPPQWGACEQSGGDLGDRIRAWFSEQCRNTPHANAILIGADCPTLTASRVHLAAKCLRKHDVVLGPARDGGYYLIGLRGCWKDEYAPLVTEIPWSSRDVFEVTQRHARSVGLSVATLPTAEDIDTIDELNRLRHHLEQQSDTVSKQLAIQIDAALSNDA